MTRNGMIALVAGILLAVAVGIGLSELLVGTTEDRNPGGSTPAAASVGGPFTLVNHDGETVTDEDFRGKYMLIYFGFTFCPDVCPTELGVMSSAVNALGDEAEKVQPIFITVDPERDTPDVMARYVELFHPRLVGLTGTPEQIDKVAKAYHVFYRKVTDESSSEDYTMDHSSIVFLMGPNGDYLKLFPPQTSPDKMAETISTHIE
ncbi:SCO family protein [Parvibaculum sp.]|jgi:protein SCO1/2|uniref:SCO family protein n=1 Tax=Parvibaculum sp. TaxID=2024848 RepID=UPI001B0B3DC9|nr:SCO family protein [Parvibaculum sp.]MBO6633981.1 SCO family protein [Parvibaculum sp.]MBO6677612.1 SCO family protein [Parvibaculum sp.]MBO6684318.1 SCO family protein [Parvibaculum sp.]MBO6905354.1 SCO family protein [Parvibaculum sp.]